jgi:hypothetical protein
MLFIAGVGIVTTAISGWEIVTHFPSSDLAEPFRQRATRFNQQGTNFIVFTTFVLRMALHVTFFAVGISLIGFSAFTAKKHLLRPRSANKI